MTTLDPALSKLRNKELSFGLHFSLGNYDGVVISEGGEVRWERGLELEGLRRQVFIEQAEIIGHPLTRGRIEQIRYEKLHACERNAPMEFDVVYNEVEIILRFYELYDQDELQRMSHEKRPELRELLVKFAEYI